MDEQEKPFDTVSIVLLMTVAGFSDAADLATALLFPVPIIGQVTYLGNSFLISPLTWAIIQGWFIMKTSGGRMSLGSFTSFIPVLGGLGNIANIPGSEMITTAVAIFMANHPKVAQVAAVAGAAAATGGASAAAAGGATGGAAGGVAATRVTATETGAAAGAVTAETGAGAAVGGAEVGAGAETTGVAGGETGGRAEIERGTGRETGGMGEREGAGEPERGISETEGSKKDTAPDERLGEEKDIFGKLQELTERTPDSDQKRNQNEDDDVTIDGNTVHL